MHPPSIRFTPRYLLGFPDSPHKRAGMRGVNSSRTKFSRRAPTMVRLQSFRHPAAAVLAYGCPLRLRSFPICYRNGDSLSRLE